MDKYAMQCIHICLNMFIWHMFIIYDGNGLDMKLSGHSMMAIMAENDNFFKQ